MTGEPYPGRRAVLLAAAALPAMPAGGASGLLGLVADYYAVAARIPRLNDTVDALLAEARRIEALAHGMEEQMGRLLDAIEAARPVTVAEAQAKLRVARALLVEGKDPGRDRFMARASTEAEQVS